MHLPENTLLQSGKYRIIRFIGSGGFGYTYEAEHLILGEHVAIKEFFIKNFCSRDEVASHVTVATQGKKPIVEKLRNKFIDEAKSLFKIRHPNIVRVSDVFEENGTAYYVMDYIEGRSLSEIVKAEDRLSEDRALKYIRQTAFALNHVHRHSRLHLGVKPGNIMIDGDDNAILTGFGASKQYDEENGESTSTFLAYTSGYAPLEQMNNSVGKFSPATDIYSLGATLYKCLTGQTPPDAVMIASGEQLSPLPPTISDAARQAVSSAMRLNKKCRLQSISDFLDILDGRAVNSSEPKQEEGVLDKDPESSRTTDPANGHEWVDLGLSVKWATCNVGASSPSDYGNYYAWGETTVKPEYNYTFHIYGEECMGDISGDSRHDAARANWGGGWRMPTSAECKELKDKCKWTWTSQDGHNGCRVTGPNGNSIFLPAAGWRVGSSLSNAGEIGYYWSSSPGDRKYPCFLSFFRYYACMSHNSSYSGQSVRAVLE